MKRVRHGEEMGDTSSVTCGDSFPSRGSLKLQIDKASPERA